MRRHGPTFRHETTGIKGKVHRRGLAWVERWVHAMQSPAGPCLVLVFLAVTGFWSYKSIQEGIEQLVEEGLATYLENNSADIDLMIDMRRRALEYFSSVPVLILEAQGLADEAADGDMDARALRDSGRAVKIRSILHPLRQGLDIHAFWIVDRSGRILTAEADEDIGRQLSAKGTEILEPAFAGEPVRQLPIARHRLLKDADESVLFPVTFGARSLGAGEGSADVVLLLIYDPRLIFERMFRSASGESDWDGFAFDETGMLISGTIHLPELKAVGLVPDEPDARAPLRVQLRDPGGDLTQGFRNETPKAAWPLTRMAASALAGESGVDLEGYRNFLGLEVLGAWTWLPEYRIGLAVEFRSSRALRLARPLLMAFGGMFALIVLITLSVMGLSYAMKVMRQRMEADQLGQYTLLSKIGEGGMGKVYKARHSMLLRDTAVKILSTESIDAQSISRFEREVQVTSQLNNPHTIEVYDYGHDEDTGVFYYAMEYLDGLTLADLLAEDGPQPAARVVHILKQACLSLAEAHEVALIHRDIKPLNIMICQRGGENDVIKVLDFGLVADVDPESDLRLTAAGVLTGTPLYIAPERVLNPAAVDARSDIYALGTVAYNLLTGKEIFEGHSSAELLDKVLRETPAPPSELLGQPIDEELERLVMACLEKDPENRPASMRAILATLDSIQSIPRWTQEQAGAWWTAYYARKGTPERDRKLPTS